MNHCVPDWDGNDGELDSFLASSPDVYLSPVKSKWESSPHRRRDCDIVEHGWTDNGLVAMQENEGKGSNPQWQNYGSNWSGSDHDSEDAVTPRKPRSNSSPGKPGDSGGAMVGNGSAGDTAAPAAVAAAPPPPPPLPQIPRPDDDDEMTAWLYPIEPSLEKNYCSDFFGDLPNSDISSIHFGREPFTENLSAAALRSIRNNVTPFGMSSSGNNMGGGGGSSLNRATSADAAMALGAGRAAGLHSQAGVEAFTKVRTNMQQPHAGGKGPPLRPNPNSSAASNAMLPPKSQPSSLQPVASGNVNFPQFSTPAWRKLQCMGGVPTHSGNGMNRMKSPMKSPLNRVASAATTLVPESSITPSSVTNLQSEGSRKDTFPQVGLEGSSGGQQSLGSESSSWALMQSSKEGEAVVNSNVGVADAVDSEPVPEDVPVDQDKSVPTAGPASVKHAHQGKEVAEAPEPTITTCSGGSGGSGNCTEQGLEIGFCSKRKAGEAEESECQSEDGEEELAETKKPVRRGSTAKRSRAAEVHNLSERRRRDRINERMKLLQELIPNSNKTDKASMLEEAIDYVKLLQAQLLGVTHELHQRNSYQQMCVPNAMNGMGVGPMVMPSAMQHLQLPMQMGSMPPIGMGMRPMVGMGMMDMGTMAPMRPSHLMPTPSPGSHGGPAPRVSATSPAVSMVDSTDHRLQNNTVMESLNVYLARQQQLHLPSQPLNMNLYNNYAMHQRQQQQLLHHQQLQQQQQQQHQHQLHPPHMGGGALQ